MKLKDDIKDIFKCPTNIPIAGILPKTDRIVVIGDVHGDILQFKKTLKLAKLIDDKDNWIGKNTILVQLGDLIDSCRGIDCQVMSEEDKGSDIELLIYLIQLNDKAMKHDGAVYSLIGNHEIMNVQGNFSYVSPKNFDNFISLLDTNDKTIDKQDIIEARKNAFKPGNPIANFLACSKLGILIIGSNLFVHGGLVPEIAKDYSPQKINEIIRQWLQGKLENPQEYNKILFSSQYSPFWVRILGKAPAHLKNDDSFCKENVQPVLDYWNVSGIHIGHTPTAFIHKKGINTTCGQSVMRHDYGSSHAFSSFDKEGRSETRKVQVVEILNDTTFNILK